MPCRFAVWPSRSSRKFGPPLIMTSEPLIFFFLSLTHGSGSFSRYTRAVIYGRAPTRLTAKVRWRGLKVSANYLSTRGRKSALRCGYYPRDVDVTLALAQVVQETLFRDKCEGMKTIIYYWLSPGGIWFTHGVRELTFYASRRPILRARGRSVNLVLRIESLGRKMRYLEREEERRRECVIANRK